MRQRADRGWRAAVFAAAIATAAGGAAACGVCLEDKVAAVYDHEVVTSAGKRGHRVAYFALEGPMPADASARRALREAIATLPGVDRRSARVSTENASCSAAFDPARASVESMTAELNRRLAPRGLAVAVLHLIEPGSRRRN